ncbi:unnamed protein product, partial [Brachionus calyciflorus]
NVKTRNLMNLETPIDICLYTSVIVFFLGLIGNLLSLVIHSRKNFGKNRLIFYFKILTIFDTYVLIFAPRNFIEDKLIDQLLGVSVEYFCKISDFSIYFGCAVSAWILVIISLDRLIKMYYPMGDSFFSKPKTQYCLISVLIVFNIGYNSPLFIYPVTSPNKTNYSEAKCQYIDELKYFWWMDLFNSTLITFSIMIISTSMTINCLFKLKLKINKTNRRDYKFSLCSIGLNLSFFLFNMPTAVFFLVSSYVDMENDIYFFLLVLTNCLFYMNFAMMFYINFAFNSSFRREFFRLFSGENSSRSSR